MTWTLGKPKFSAPDGHFRLSTAPCRPNRVKRRGYGITDNTPFGTPSENDTQKIDAARARAALDRARNLADAEQQEREPAGRTGSTRIGPTL